MKTLRLMVAGLVLSLSPGALRAHAEELYIGSASADITPPVPYRMSGYFSERVSTGTHDPLWARALYLRQGAASAVMVFCDIIGVPREVSARIRQAIGESTAAPVGSIVVAGTHSHTGPLYFGALRNHFHDQAVAQKGLDTFEQMDYAGLLVERIRDAAAQAKKAARAVQLSAGLVRQPGLSFNRRFFMNDGSVQFNPGKLNPNIVKAAGPVDPDIGILFFQGQDSGLPQACLSSFALHLDTVGGTEYSADYPYYLEQALKARFGNLFLSYFGTGTCGDLNHIDVSDRQPQKGHEEAARIGTTLARTLLASLPGFRRVTPTLAARSATVRLPIQRYTPEQLAKARRDLFKVGSRELSFLEQVEAYRVASLALYGSDTLQAEVQALRFGPEVAVVALPGEVFVELGLAVKAASPFATTLVLELCNDAPGYIPTRKAFAEGSYETVNSRIEPGGGEKLVEAASRLLSQLK